MEYEIACGCGKGIPVTEAMAGSLQSCECGQTVVVPPLSTLRATVVLQRRHRPAGSGSFHLLRQADADRQAGPRRDHRPNEDLALREPGEDKEGPENRRPWWP